MISYDPLRKTLHKKNIKRTELIKRCNLSATTLSKLSKYQSVTLTVIEKICKELDCKIEEVVEIVNEEEK